MFLILVKFTPMPTNKPWYRKKRFLIPLILVGLTLIAAIIWPFVLPGLVESRLRQRLEISENEKLEFKELSVGIFPLSLAADSLTLKKQVQAQKHNWWLEAQLADLHLQLPVWQFLSGGNQTTIGAITWAKGEIRLDEGNRLTERKKQKDSTGQKSTYLVETINLGETFFRAQRDTQRLEASLELDLIGLEIGGSENSLPQWRNINLKVKDFMAFAITPDYNLSFKALTANSEKQELSITNLSYAVRFGKQEMQQKHKYMQVQTRLKIEEVLFNGLEINKLPKGLFAKSIVCSEAYYQIYQDASAPRPKDTIPLPSESLLKMDYSVDVDTFKLKNSRLLFEGKSKDAADLAVLRGNNWQGQIWNLSNVGYKESVPLGLQSQIDFYNQARLSLKASFDSNSTAQQFTVIGNLQNTALSPFNEVLKPILGFYFKEGYLNEIRFDMRGNKRSIDGKLFANYQNVKIGFGDRSDGILKNLGEWAGNKIAVNRNEPGSWHKFQYERIPNRSIINYWWKALQKGLIDVLLSLGLSEADEGLDFGLADEGEGE